jgi:hypothetical protein
MSYREDVRNYLIKEAGIHVDRVDDLLNKGTAEVVSGMKLGSYPYYPGGQIIQKYSTDEDFDPNFVPPPEVEDDSEED